MRSSFNSPSGRPRRTSLSPLLAAALAFACFSPIQAAADFQAAIATRDVTPDPLLPVSGGVGPSAPAKSAQGRLTVRAAVFQQGTQRLAIVSADFLGFPKVLGDRVRRRVAERVPPTHVLIGATHTHSAPDCYGFPDGKGGTGADLPYLDTVCSRMAEAIEEACQRLQPASLRIQTGVARGKIAYNYYAEQLYDPRCHVIQALDRNGKPLLTLVNYAIHPEVLGPSQGVLSPDLVGPLCDRIQQQGGGVGLFMNGAQGGMVTADCRGPDGRDVQTWAECVRIGHLLADEALRIVGTATPIPNPPLAVHSRTFTFPIDSPMMRQILQASPLGYSTQDPSQIQTQVNLVNLGDAQILTIPGEALPNIGYFLKRNMRGKHNFLFGLTNDAFGYILARVDFNSFSRYDYISRTSLGENTGELFINQSLDFIQATPVPALP